MLDVHVLTMPTTRPEWVAQRRASIAAAVEAAGFPVHVHEIEGVTGHIGKGRALGYSLGTAPYVTYVDDDDYLLPNAFSVLREGMESGAESVAPGEILAQGAHRSEMRRRHHLIAYRREVANSFAHNDWAVCGDLALSGSTGGFEVIDCVYVHRLYESGGRKLRRENMGELKKAWACG